MRGAQLIPIVTPAGWGNPIDKTYHNIVLQNVYNCLDHLLHVIWKMGVGLAFEIMLEGISSEWTRDSNTKIRTGPKHENIWYNLFIICRKNT